jgi:hypothetical protein
VGRTLRPVSRAALAVETAQLYLHVMQKGSSAVSPLDKHRAASLDRLPKQG